MSTPLRPLGPAWLPLLDAAVEALARGGLDPSPLWPTPTLQRAALERLGALLDRVAIWNARIDLTAARSERELVDLYLADALVLAVHGAQRTASLPESERWIDVGSGAGAPGLALGLLWPMPELTLVEPRQKRVAFLRNAAGASAARAPLQVVEGRSQSVAAASHDVAISRATFSPEEWLAEGARLALRQVWVLLARGAAPELAGWSAAPPVDYEWPLTQAPRRAILYTRDAAATS
ncbi:MAG TPA: RsmG family class I SAM-dependent methyltransferase [Polyangiaceae bacterium]|nr:RsmG family class I SAM-dependent methyltransferase [Polyangiaceae bacterium]